jgi:translation initiation factor 3 subunit A
MSTHHINPETALRKAEEYDKHGLHEAALEPLYSILSNRRYRTWHPNHEKIMEKYIDLAIKLRKNMREALVKYRVICQENNSESFEKIINLYREKAEARAEHARKQAEEQNVKESDAEFEESPGSIMLQAVSGTL